MVPCREPKPLLGGECDLKGEWLLDIRPDSFGFLRNRSPPNARCSAPTTHLRARFAFMPLAVATTARDVDRRKSGSYALCVTP